MKAKIEQFPAINPNPALSVGKDGTVLYSNEAGEPLLRKWGVEIGEKLPSDIGNLVQHVISRKSPEKMEVKVRDRVYLVVFHPISEQECVNISGFDISGQKETDEELLEIEKNYRMLFTNITDAFLIAEAICNKDGKPIDYRILDINPAVELHTGLKSEQILGRSMLELFPNVSPIDLEKYSEVALSGKSKKYEVFSQKLNKFLDIYMFSPEKGKFGLVFRDITERKKAEEELKKAHDALEERTKKRTSELENAYNLLKESEQSLAEAQELAHIGNWSRDIATGKVHWSEEAYRIFGFKPQDFGVTYDSFLSLVHPCDLEFVINAGKQALNGDLFEAEYRFIRNDGVEHIVHEKIKVIFDKKNNPIQLKGIVQDITEKKKAEEALMKIETARKKEIHHRIKNNLQVISSLLDLQADKFKNKMFIKRSEVMEAFKESQDRVISMALIHEELYKGEEIEKINFSQYINELANNLLLTYRVENDSISLDMDIKEEIFFDMDMAVPLGIIINELVSNSLKHAFRGREKGEIQIKLHNDKNGEINSNGCKSTSYILVISDNGIGIPENLDIEDLDSLGLQLVTSLVDQLDGELELIRNNGAEFIIKFTVTEETNQASSKVIQSII